MVSPVSLLPRLTDWDDLFVGELGLGPNESKSATKPTRNQPLNGVDVFQ